LEPVRGIKVDIGGLWRNVSSD